MAYTTPTTRITGELITASIWNTDMVDNIIALAGYGTILAAQPAYAYAWMLQGDVGGADIRGGGGAYDMSATFYIPTDFSTLVSLDVITIADAAGTAYYDLRTDYGAIGEAESMHSSAVSNQSFAATTTWKVIDASSLVASLAAGDFLGVYMDRGSSAWTTTTQICVPFVVLVYSR